jgi:hypothetical protein
MSVALQPESREQEFENEGLALISRVNAIVIADAEGYSEAAELLKALKSSQHAITEFFAEMKAAAHRSWKAVCSKEAGLLEHREQAESIVKRKLATYQAEQERKRLLEESRLRDEARKREEDRIQAEALEAEEDGDHAAAEEIISQPIAPPPVRTEPAVQKIAGISFRETWQFEITNLASLIAHCAAHLDDRNLLTPNMTAIRSLVTSRKDLCKIPGIRVWKETGVAAGRK